MAEQKAEQEEKKLAELQKQLDEERQIQELRRLQAAQGQDVKNLDSSMDWMYEGPQASNARQQTQQSEEYLLGKIYKAPDSKTFDLSIPVMDNKQDNSWMSKISSKNDIFSRMHEDPMVALKKAEKKVSRKMWISALY
ncbi:hypothetical protein EON65_44365 [archaeon]|nr:MAG: hypothetical protein EON65_44365 [archaeon]